MFKLKIIIFTSENKNICSSIGFDKKRKREREYFFLLAKMILKSHNICQPIKPSQMVQISKSLFSFIVNDYS